jgi:tetratricopeptide (TPR) repeat protein
MTAPILMTDCPTEETLAAYVDDRLDAATRRKVTEHLASCGECREIVMMATDYQVNEMPAVVHGKFGWVAAAAGLAAAAVIAIFVLRPALMGPQMDDVYAQARELATRPTQGKPAGDFAYKKAYSPPRSGTTGTATNVALLEIALEAKDPQVKGMAFLLLSESERQFYDEAVAALEEAYRNAKPRNRDVVAINLATALLSNWSDEKGYQRALELSNEVLERQQSPEARWNRAAALELLGKDEEAIAAWRAYLNLERDSEWGKEAERRRNELIELTKR